MKTKNIKNNQDSIPLVELKSVTWSKESHGLFDYEFANYEMKKIQATQSVRIFRMDSEVFCQPKTNECNNNISPEVQYLMSITQERENSDNFYIDIPGDFGNSPNHIPTHLIIRSLKSSDGKKQRGYELQIGDTIKMGRVEFKVLEKKYFNPKGKLVVESITEDKDDDTVTFNTNNQEIKGEEICRYCLMDKIEGDEFDNTIIYPCDCKGSAGGVHFICLKNWIGHKIISKSSYMTVNYLWKKFQCELCKVFWPKKVKIKSEIKELICVERPDTPYLMLEKLGDPEDINNVNNLSIIVFNENDQIEIGRGHSCDLRISDISVSRVHSLITFKDNKFMMFDNDSKFGTLILLKNRYKVKSDKAAVQIGRTVLTFVLKYAKKQTKK